MWRKYIHTNRNIKSAKFLAKTFICGRYKKAAAKRLKIKRRAKLDNKTMWYYVWEQKFQKIIHKCWAFDSRMSLIKMKKKTFFGIVYEVTSYIIYCSFCSFFNAIQHRKKIHLCVRTDLFLLSKYLHLRGQFSTRMNKLPIFKDRGKIKQITFFPH